MIIGRLERLFSGTYVEGWASETEAPGRALAIEIRTDDGSVVAEGLANLYREDLANAPEGLGWCAFRLRLARPAAEFRRSPLALHEKGSGYRVDVVVGLPLIAGNVQDAGLGADIAGFDPFVIAQISQLRACEDLFARFVRSKSASAFVRMAYIYMLGRPADPETLALHAEMLAKGQLAPLRLLRMIAETREFRARPRELAAPNAPGFPFVEAMHAR